jgi:hypothetical protein
MGKINTSLKSSTILETIVALVIILTIFGIATVVFVRTTATSMSTSKLAAQQLLSAYAASTEQQRQFFNDDRRVGPFEIRRTVSASSNLPNLWQIHYYIYDRRDSLLSDWQSLAIAE